MEIALTFQRKATRYSVAQQVARNETRKIALENAQPFAGSQTVKVLRFREEPTAGQSIQIARPK